ncbi:Bax inhibitor-1/YccA family protein [Microbacterium sp. SORGH_AS_0888]|uniref:Bax inhibitor-1/YccA family membrane protein n=1 Tax=Microbacterium sp. SORGH_AS_0888 TaxID=3041791 RepID=UPI002782BAF9|nr:Bax inhibitor-1/YccA family protein [Microbacterium sp. SORGH_AS_0888]MDQ1128971.1 putative YccA/Bax inhibitor family protein [Microbacterium sp. SORGH_AS_0888]
MIRRRDRGLAGGQVVPRTLGLSAIFFVLLHPAALLGVAWTVGTVTTSQTLEGATPGAWITGVIGCLALAFWPSNSTTYLRTRVVCFVLSEGLLLGGVVTHGESILPGIAIQLSFAAFSTTIGALAVLSTARVRSTSQLNRVALVAVTAYLVFVLHNLGFAGMGLPIQAAWGAGSQILLGIPIGLLLGLLLVPLASCALVRRVARADLVHFDDVEPTHPWRAAQGIIATIIWPWGDAPRKLLRRGLVRSG